MGCRINLYGPLITNLASFAGIGEILSLLFLILIKAHTTNKKEIKINTKERIDDFKNDVPQINKPKRVNCMVTNILALVIFFKASLFNRHLVNYY